MRIAITGGNGNLARKLIAGFGAQPWCSKLVALDRRFDPIEAPGHATLDCVEADLRQPDDRRWLNTIASVDAVVHLAAQNPYPEADWTDSAASFDMTALLFRAAAQSGVRRFVFATSNHVMGGYKDTDIATTPGSLHEDLPPLPGTRWRNDAGSSDSTPYAVAKLMGERLCCSLATRDGLTAVALRIGWCQPGENHPSSISASGTPNSRLDNLDAAARCDLAWFRGMWLSNRDLVGIFEASLRADATRWPQPGIVVNAVSGNRGMAWDMTRAREWLRFVPTDDMTRELGLQDAPTSPESDRQP
ncbi:NAD-dependent epimerase/dehydratase family protein [Kaistia granuli]|uniref:NAD-dependent epimerase/dehydratase family protein n=1 Tax=Kaistia granuli TaxID=363259 RepID=UPI00036224A8|nr:NAD(P)-dependent oxidoreductase [Kaistia granuli]